MKVRSTLTCASLLAIVAAPASAQLFGPGDTLLAVDPDVGVRSSYPGAESPLEACDNDINTKYLNFGREGTGFIVTPSFGPSTVVSMQFNTANDAPERDPATWELWGTNDAIVSDDNSDGMAENWTLIASGNADLPDDRQVPGPVYDFANGTQYESYKVIFPSIKDGGTANSMQVADVLLYTGSGGSGDQVLNGFNDTRAVGLLVSESFYPGLESPANLLDGDVNTKYLNFGRENSGFIIARADGQATVVESFTITTANDFPERDPTSYEFYGTNDELMSEDNSAGDAETWIFISAADLDLPLDRFTESVAIDVGNTNAYTAYKLQFPTVREPSDFPGDSVQMAEVFFDGQGGGDPCVADFDDNGVVDTRDVLAFLAAWNDGDASADIDDNTVIDTRDVLAFLSLWTEGC